MDIEEKIELEMWFEGLSVGIMITSVILYFHTKILGIDLFNLIRPYALFGAAIFAIILFIKIKFLSKYFNKNKIKR